MGRKRKHNKDLPRHWQFKHGQYYYVVPKKERHLFNQLWVPLGNTKRAALIKFAELPIHSNVDTRVPTTIDELVTLYESQVLPYNAEGTRMNKLSYIPSIRAGLGHMLIDDVRQTHAKQLFNSLVRLRGRKTAKEVVGCLRHMLTFAVEEGFTEDNRIKGLRLKGNPPRKRLVTYEEARHFIDEFASDLLKVYVPLKLLTGLDKQSLLALTVRDVTEDGLTAVRRKNSSKPKLYRWDDAGELRKVIEDIEAYRRSQGVRSVYLFANRKGQPYLPQKNGQIFDEEGHALGRPEGFNSIWNRSMAKWVAAGHERFTEHDLRKTPASATTTVHAQQLLDHHSPEITRRVYQVDKNVVEIQPRPSSRSGEDH